MSFDAIPDELRERPQWVVWRLERAPGKDKPTKMPYRSDGTGKASSTNPRTWSTFAAAVSAAGALDADGIGYVFSETDPYFGLDLDGKLPEADRGAIVSCLDTYTELSVSGEGFHVIGRGTLDAGRHPEGLGAFDRARYFVMTGAHVRGCPTTIEERQTELDGVLSRYLPPKTPPDPAAVSTQPVDLDDQELLDRAFAARNGADFRALWEGNWQGLHGSQSEADLDLCGRLAFWTGRDHLRIDRMFRSSGLIRGKWDERRDDSTYSANTVGIAIAGCRDVYTPPKLADENEDPSPESDEGHTAPLTSPTSLSSPIDGWPGRLNEAALHGLAGDYVRLVEPHTEADPVAILLQTLVFAGNAIGRRPYVRVEADKHHVNLAAVLIGDTSKARKGTSLGHARAPVAAADEHWVERIAHGLSSGEGLIHAVRDERYGLVDGEEKLVDEGVADKRLQVIEGEFVSVLKVASRDGSTLTAVVRNAWDTGDLRTLTRRDPLKATGAHISIVGHITVEELRRYLDATEAANGFGNRFLWACVRRSKSLPEGGHVPDASVRTVTTRLVDALDFARRQDEVRRDEPARALWRKHYDRLAQGRPGLVGALLARAEAQVLRLSLVYALLDKSREIRTEHLNAALALWDYCEQSVTHVFGDSTGNPDADQILVALRRSSEGLSRTEISNLFGRHLSAARIGRALTQLLERNAAHPTTLETGGRPVERWHVYANEAKEAKEVR